MPSSQMRLADQTRGLLITTASDGVRFLQKRPRDFCWAKEGDVLPLIEHLEHLQVCLSPPRELLAS